MNARRTATLRAVAATFAPPDARLDRVAQLAALAIDGLSPGRRAELEALLDLLTLPMRAQDATRAGIFTLFARSPSSKLRTAFAALKRLTLFLSYAESEPGSDNPNWARLGYPGPRDDVPPPNEPPLPLAEARDGERVEADVVVVGSGAGGGVAAAAFARAGKRVVVLEAGGAYDARRFTQRELMLSELYLDGGLTASDDLGIAILAGATLGGGTTVNWCTSFRLPERIAAEWEAQSGLDGLAAEFAPHYDALEERLEIAPLDAHFPRDRTLVDGARALGVHAGAMPRNAPRDCGAGCGYCGLGCAYEKKRSTTRAFLPDVVAAAGAIYANAKALNFTLQGARATAVSVEQTPATGAVRRFEVVADLFVCAAGTLRTPGLLARSGVRHPLLGRRLFLHPAAVCTPRYAEAIDPWTGPLQSAYSDAFNYRTGNYGPKIETAPTHPGIAALSLPWTSRTQHAAEMLHVRHNGALVALTRDRDPGSIDLDDEAQIRYRVSPFDAENLIAGIAGMFDLAFAGGAQRVTTLHARPIVVERTQWSAAARERLLERLRAIGTASNRQILFSAHQMGTASMGADPARSVVDASGAVWGFENLLVVDASVFPQASGVNPMLTIMASARRIASLHGGRAPQERAAALPIER